MRIITYQTYICWEIDNFVINKSDIFRGFFICKNILKKLSCYHNNYFNLLHVRKIQWFCQEGEGSCMHVFSSTLCILLGPVLYVEFQSLRMQFKQ
jgi:hypothetical protein